MRKIRAYYRGDFRNAAILPIPEIRTILRLILNFLLDVFFLQFFDDLPAFPGNKAVDPFVVRAVRMCITGLNAY